MGNYYVYRFMDNKGKIIYIGKTNNIKKRMEIQHFSNSGHLPRGCYLETSRIEYSKLKSDNAMRIYEIYLIGKYAPLYNQEFNYKDEGLDMVLADLIWTEYAITEDMRVSIKPEYDEAYWIAKDIYDIESWKICFAALGGGL